MGKLQLEPLDRREMRQWYRDATVGGELSGAEFGRLSRLTKGIIEAEIRDAASLGGE